MFKMCTINEWQFISKNVIKKYIKKSTTPIIEYYYFLTGYYWSVLLILLVLIYNQERGKIY
jgi:hypothetical protein